MLVLTLWWCLCPCLLDLTAEALWSTSPTPVSQWLLLWFVVGSTDVTWNGYSWVCKTCVSWGHQIHNWCILFRHLFPFPACMKALTVPSLPSLSTWHVHVSLWVKPALDVIPLQIMINSSWTLWWICMKSFTVPSLPLLSTCSMCTFPCAANPAMGVITTPDDD